MRAALEQVCHRCDHLIRVGDRIAKSRGGFVHASCAPGGDDE